MREGLGTTKLFHGKYTGTADATFAMRQRMKKHLEKAYGRVPRQEVWRRKREKGVSDINVMIVQNMYEGANVGLTD